MKKRLIVVLALVMLLFGSTVYAYSIWDNLQANETDITIPVNDGGVTISVSPSQAMPAGTYLVPVGAVLQANTVDSAVLTYDVSLDKQTQSDLDLTVTASNILIGGSSTYSTLVDVAISPASPTVNQAGVTVTVTITLTEPTTQAAYDAIVNQNITFDLSFVATQPA